MDPQTHYAVTGDVRVAYRLSGTVKDLVVGPGLEFTDRGRHSLTDAPGEWRVYALGS